jgi:hypothetical protein
MTTPTRRRDAPPFWPDIVGVFGYVDVVPHCVPMFRGIGLPWRPTAKGSKVQPDAGDIGDRSAPLAPKVRLVCLEDLDGRRTASRRAYELIAAFEADLGGKLTLADRLAVRRAAMLSALAEHEASRQMAGEATDIDQVVRLSNAARRAVADLNLPKRDKRTTGPTLQEYLDAKYPVEPEQPASESADGEPV